MNIFDEATYARFPPMYSVPRNSSYRNVPQRRNGVRKLTSIRNEPRSATTIG